MILIANIFDIYFVYYFYRMEEAIHSDVKDILDKYLTFIKKHKDSIENMIKDNEINNDLTEEDINEILNSLNYAEIVPLLFETEPVAVIDPTFIKLDTIAVAQSSEPQFKYPGFTNDLGIGNKLEKKMVKIVSGGTTFIVFAIKVNMYTHVLTFKNACRFHYKKEQKNISMGMEKCNVNCRHYICGGNKCCAKETNILCGTDEKCCVPFISYKYNYNIEVDCSFRTVSYPYKAFVPTEEQYESFITEFKDIINNGSYRSNMDVVFLIDLILMIDV